MTSATVRTPDEQATPYQLPQPADMSRDLVHLGILDKWLEDDNLWAPMTGTVSFKPLLLSASQGYYVNLLRVLRLMRRGRQGRRSLAGRFALWLIRLTDRGSPWHPEAACVALAEPESHEVSASWIGAEK
jgi:hypothetical protein